MFFHSLVPTPPGEPPMEGPPAEPPPAARPPTSPGDGSFPNTRPQDLHEELGQAESLGVKPIKAGEPGFDAVINSGTVKWAVTTEGELVIVPKWVQGTEISHSVLTGGRPVLAAGEAEIFGSNGQYYFTNMTNHSGHFMPSESSLEIGRRAFIEMGIRQGFDH
jgi:hypothetical protein